MKLARYLPSGGISAQNPNENMLCAIGHEYDRDGYLAHPSYFVVQQWVFAEDPTDNC